MGRLTTHFYPLRGEMTFKTCNSMMYIAMVRNTEYTVKTLLVLVFRGCGVVATHQLPKAM